MEDIVKLKILHIGLSSHFTEGMLYQDNILANLNANAGMDVTFISDAYKYEDGCLVETEECDVILNGGVRLIRLKYDKIINDFISKKIQKIKRLVEYIEEIKPDSILYHGVCGYELMDVANYVKKNKIPFYIDSHENFSNTAKTILSKIAYKYIHGVFVKKALPNVKKILYVGYPERDYLKEMYQIPENKMEFFPLGGLVIEKEQQSEYRKRIIKEMNFPENVIICAHSGKMDEGKKTEEVLLAFSKVQNKRLRLLIYGSIPENRRTILEPMIKRDSRVKFLGWKNAKEQEIILGGSDLYIQPGTYSATAQIALCSGCALLVNNGYKRAMKDAVLYGEDKNDIENVLRKIISHDGYLDEIKEKGYNYAKKFNYKELALRYLN